MAAIKSVDHKGTEFPSFKAMCEKWHKKPATVKRRLENTFHNWPLEMALEIPEIPGYKFTLVKVDSGTLYFRVKINPHYKQYAQYDCEYLSTAGIYVRYTFEQIKKIFPKDVGAFKKGQMVGMY